MDDDRALIDAARGGDREAFGLLADRELGAVYRTCLRILGRPHDAEDVTQETFVAAFRAIAGYRGDAPPRAWLVRIAQRQSYRRLAQRRPTTTLEAITEDRLTDTSAEPTRVLVEAESRASLRQAVAGLPDPYREVIALRFFGELSLGEVADATGRPLGTVKTHLRRGLERLRPLLATAEADR